MYNLFAESIFTLKEDADVDFVKKAFKHLFFMYDQKVSTHSLAQRAYHNLFHIKYGLSAIGDIISNKNILTKIDISLLNIAWFFHDCVYYSDQPLIDNEVESAEKAKYILNMLQIRHEDILKIYNLIIKTKHTQPIDNDGNNIYNFIADIDLLGLAESSKVFRINSYKIRMEYIHVPEIDYLNGRLAIFKSFVNNKNRSSIFRSVLFKNIYESRAQFNIKQEIDNINISILSKNIILEEREILNKLMESIVNL